MPGHTLPGRILIMASVFLGGGSLLLFTAFLYIGSFQLFDLVSGTLPVLLWDAFFLSLCFFLQHSLMARPSVKAKLSSIMPPHAMPAVYSLTSGAFLLTVLLLWQRTLPDLIIIPPPWRWILRVLFFACLLFAFWSGRHLGRLDPLGIRQLLADKGRSASHDRLRLVTTGPYSVVRHPMYTVTLILIWLCPDVSGDRLLFNILWSGWIVVAAKLEERDLEKRFGQDYQDYKQRVPFLFPRLRP